MKYHKKRKPVYDNASYLKIFYWIGLGIILVIIAIVCFFTTRTYV